MPVWTKFKLRTTAFRVLGVVAWAGFAAAQSLAQAQTPRNDLAGIYRDAVANDPTYASARFAQQAAVEKVPQARSGLLPNINAGVGYSLTNFHLRSPSYTDTYSSFGPSLTLTIPLYRPQLRSQVDQASLSVKQSEAQLAQARQDLILRVAQAYFDLLATVDSLEAIGANKKAVSENLAQAKREFQVGTKTIVDTHEAQARFDQIVAQEQVALGDALVKRAALRAIIGRDPGTLVTLRDPPQLTGAQPADLDAWAKRAEENNFGVAQAQAGADSAKIEIARAKEGYLPTVDLSASVNQNRSTGSTTSLTGATTYSRTATIGVQLNVPIYSGGLTQSRVREALANEEKARQDLELAKRNAAQGARQAYSGVDYGLSQVRALESAEISAKSQLDSTRLGYQVGVRINLDVLNATTQLFNTQRDLKRARYDFLINSLKLQAAAGSLDDNDVNQVNVLLVP